jgi:hypothetical protein
MNLTWNKAAIGGLAAPIVAYLLTFLQDWTVSTGHPIPDAALAALQALLVGLAVYFRAQRRSSAGRRRPAGAHRRA